MLSYTVSLAHYDNRLNHVDKGDSSMSENIANTDAIIFIKVKVNEGIQLTPELKEQLCNTLRIIEFPLSGILSFTEVLVVGVIEKNFNIMKEK